MSRLNLSPRVGISDPVLQRELREHATQVNLLSEGRIAAVTNATTAAPASGPNLQGDFLRNSAPVEAGTAGSKYIVHGWLCVASGTPGTWVPCRFLTGN
jgi:hypothetical protein